MAGIENINQLDLATSTVSRVSLSIAELLLTFFVVLVLVAVVGFAYLMLKKFLEYKYDVEFYELKRDKLEFYGDDKAKRQTKKGSSKILFRKNKDGLFKGNDFPPKKFLYKKKFFGSKIKYVIGDNDIFPARFELSNDDTKKLLLTQMPSYERTALVNKLEEVNIKYQNTNSKQMMITIGMAGMAFIVLLVGLYVIWQSNVATASANAALSGATQELAKAVFSVGTIPAAP